MNNLFAFLVIMIVFSIGEIISKKSKARLSMIFVSGLIFMIAFWLGLSQDIFEQSGLLNFASVTICMLMAHIGSTIKIRVFILEWKTVIISALSTSGIALSVYFFGRLFINHYYALASAPVLAGGMVSYFIMQNVGPESIKENVNAFIALILVFQTFVGIPIANVGGRFAAREYLCKHEQTNSYFPSMKNEENSSKLKIIKILNKSEILDLPYVILTELGLIGYVATEFEKYIGVNSLLLALVFGILFHEVGIVRENALMKANGFTFVMAGALCNIFNALRGTSLNLFIKMLYPLFIVFITGLIGCLGIAFFASKMLKFPVGLGIALGCTAFFGFPGTYLISDEIASAYAPNSHSYKLLMQYLMPKMVLAGIVSMSIVSVAFAIFMKSW